VPGGHRKLRSSLTSFSSKALDISSELNDNLNGVSPNEFKVPNSTHDLSRSSLGTHDLGE